MTVIVEPSRALAKQQGPRLVLRLGKNECIVSGERPRCTAGRSSRNDLVIADSYASRLHAEIEYRSDKFFITDRSTNGTFVQPKQGEEIVLHRDQASLDDSGAIGFGRRPDADPELAIEFVRESGSETL